MKNKMKVKTKVMVGMIVVLCAMIIVNAAVITYYGRVNTTIESEYYILFDGTGHNNVSVSHSIETGECVTSYHTIENVHSSLNIMVNITTTADYIDGIDLDVYFLPWSTNVTGFDCDNLTGTSYRSFETEPLHKYHVFIKYDTDIALIPDTYYIVTDFVPGI